jgi:hypothetical protein
MKFLTVQLPPFSRHLIPLRSATEELVCSAVSEESVSDSCVTRISHSHRFIWGETWSFTLRE